jgi:hypothetical protein
VRRRRRGRDLLQRSVKKREYLVEILRRFELWTAVARAIEDFERHASRAGNLADGGGEVDRLPGRDNGIA